MIIERRRSDRECLLTNAFTFPICTPNHLSPHDILTWCNTVFFQFIADFTSDELYFGSQGFTPVFSEVEHYFQIIDSRIIDWI